MILAKCLVDLVSATDHNPSFWGEVMGRKVGGKTLVKSFFHENLDLRTLEDDALNRFQEEMRREGEGIYKVNPKRRAEYKNASEMGIPLDSRRTGKALSAIESTQEISRYVMSLIDKGQGGINLKRGNFTYTYEGNCLKGVG